MKKLVEFVKIEFKETCKKFFSPMKYKWFWALTIGITIPLFLYDEHQLGKENYKLLPKRESEILQKYDGGIKGFYFMEDMRKLLMDYDLVARETPREILELMRGRMKKIDEPNDYNNKRADIFK